MPEIDRALPAGDSGAAPARWREAECVMLHFGPRLFELEVDSRKSGPKKREPIQAYLVNAMKHLDDIDRYARGIGCGTAALRGGILANSRSGKMWACDLCWGIWRSAEP